MYFCSLCRKIPNPISLCKIQNLQSGTNRNLKSGVYAKLGVYTTFLIKYNVFIKKCCLNIFILFILRYPEHSQTTRTIERLVGGHLHHPVYRKEDETSVQQSTRLSKLYFRRKSPIIGDRSTTTRYYTTSTTEAPITSTDRVQIVTPINHRKNNENNDDDDDEALLSDDNRLDTWQNELIAASAGAGPEQLPKPAKDESKKTLSDQVAEGKYGLIQKELFPRPPKRPGIISYLPNPEVPNDTADNLGGLEEDDIWLGMSV